MADRLTLDLHMALQEQRIRQRLLTQRDDLPEQVPMRAHDLTPPRRTLSDTETDDIMARRAEGWPLKRIAAAYGISLGWASVIASGRRYEYASRRAIDRAAREQRKREAA